MPHGDDDDLARVSIDRVIDIVRVTRDAELAQLWLGLRPPEIGEVCEARERLLHGKLHVACAEGAAFDQIGMNGFEVFGGTVGEMHLHELLKAQCGGDALRRRKLTALGLLQAFKHGRQIGGVDVPRRAVVGRKVQYVFSELALPFGRELAQRVDGLVDWWLLASRVPPAWPMLADFLIDLHWLLHHAKKADAAAARL